MTNPPDAQPPSLSATTSVAVAGETLGEGCGLGHYLACLQLALDEQKGRRSIEVLGAAQPPADVPLVSHGILKRLLRPFHRRLAALAARPPAEAWAASWQAMGRATVCLLPHVVCNDHGALDWYYATLMRRPLVWVVHDLHPLHFPEQWQPEFVAAFARRCRSLALRAHTIICHNAYTKADVCERLDADPDKIVVVHLPSILPTCDSKTLPPAMETLRTHGIRQPYALWASSSTFAHKNHDRLLRAWKLLRERGLDIQLVCTGGKEPRWPAIARLIDELGLGDRVVFTGNVSRAVLWVILLNAKLAVCPTLFEGGGSGPAAEAIASQIPVACSRIPQVLEQLAGRLDLCEWFDPLDEAAIADAVANVLADDARAHERAAHAAEIFPRLRSWEEVARVYWQAIERAAASAR
jgi:glycosyltransferase involved in cell wall biosynthesis